MSQLHRFLAFILFLVFSFPVIYQQVHVFEHTPEEKTACCHGHCSLELEEIQVAFEGIAISEKQDDEESCPLCEYKFTFNQQPKGIHLYVLFSYYQELQSVHVHDSFNSSCVLGSSSRAPPFIV